ncbi:metastin precursor [Oryzias latipes]|uniref:Metastin n=1 Tax=Oryzias latipes TaxID=8090 RepID=A9ZMG6_ORYLA|nr:metastasis-suppressor KiSS-1 precursor [Oryzias latipes]BAF98208.1 metastin [Oryzias latipes]
MAAPLIVAVIMWAVLAQVWTAHHRHQSTIHTEDNALLKMLRNFNYLSSSMKEWPKSDRSSDGGTPMVGCWMVKALHPVAIKKRQDLSSYNLNSFGLRYGK